MNAREITGSNLELPTTHRAESPRYYSLGWSEHGERRPRSPGAQSPSRPERPKQNDGLISTPCLALSGLRIPTGSRSSPRSDGGDIFPGLAEIPGPKARNITAWAEASIASAGPGERLPDLSRPEGPRHHRILSVRCDALSGLGRFHRRLTWASARCARSSPGCYITGLQPSGIDTTFCKERRRSQAGVFIFKMSKLQSPPSDGGEGVCFAANPAIFGSTPT